MSESLGFSGNLIIEGFTAYWNYKRKFPIQKQKRFLKTFSRLLKDLNPNRAILLMKEQSAGIELEILQDIDDSLRSGGKIYEACEPWFDRMVVVGIKFGEENNQLKKAVDEAMVNLSLSNANLFGVFAKVIYPLIITFGGMSMISFVGEKLLKIIDYKLKKRISLPIEMKFFKGVINFYDHWLVIVIVLTALIAAAFFIYLRTSTSDLRLKLDKYFLFSEYRLLCSISFLRQLSMLKRFNLGDLIALNSISTMATSPYMKYHIGQMMHGMKSGKEIGAALDTGMIDANDVLTFKVLSDAAEGEFVSAIDSTCEGATDEIISKLEKISSALKYFFLIIGCLMLLDLAVVMMTVDQYMK